MFEVTTLGQVRFLQKQRRVEAPILKLSLAP